MFDIKEMKTIIQQIAEARQLSEDSLWEAIEAAFGAAYKREYGKNDQIIRSRINRETGEPSFFQVKQVMDESTILPEDEAPKDEDEARVRFNPERHIMVADAQLVRQGVTVGEEILFPLEAKVDFGRIAAQSARQAVTQKIHETERDAVIAEFKDKEGTLTHGQVQRIERGNVFVDLGRTVAILPYSQQIRSERFKQGDIVRAYVQSIDTTRRSGGFVRLSRTHPNFVVKLFEMEVPELAEGLLEVKAVSREPGVRTKIAILSTDPSIDPVGSLVGQRGVRVMTVKSELGGEQIDIVSWSENPSEFIIEALLPAEVFEVKLDEEHKVASVKASDEQMPVVIGKGGQNLKLAAQMTGWEIVITDTSGKEVAKADTEGVVTISGQKEERREDGRNEEKAAGDETSKDEGKTDTDAAETATETKKTEGSEGGQENNSAEQPEMKEE